MAASSRMFTSWDGPPTTDPAAIRKRRMFFLFLVVLFVAIAAGALWLGQGRITLLHIAGGFAVLAVVFYAIDGVIKRRQKKRRT